MPRESFRPAPADGRNMVRLPESADALPERVVVNLDDKDPNAFQVVVRDDTPEEDRGRPTEVGQSLADQEEELRDLSDSRRVQKRIDRLRYETHTERRAREAAERERDAAVEEARQARTEAERLRMQVNNSTVAMAESMKAERQARIEDATRRLEAAHADGDSAAIAKATADLTKANAELVTITANTPQRQATPQNPQPQAQTQQPQNPNDRLAPNVRDWISRNSSWFQKDQERTAKAMSIHYDLVARGVDPSSGTYIRELDKEMKKAYKDHQMSDGYSDGFDDGRRDEPRSRRTNAVEPGSREESQASPSGGAPRTVELTQSEVSLANRLRIPLQKYAEEKARRMQQEKGGAR